MTTPAPAPVLNRKAAPLRPEPPKKLTAGSPVVDDAGRFGKVRTVLPGDRFAVQWEDGAVESVHPRAALRARFTSSTPRPRRKAAR